MVRIAHVSALIALVTACVSPTALQTARTLDKGDARVGAAVHFHRAPVDSRPGPTQPDVEVFARVGVAESIDCGWKVWPVFLRGDCKHEFLRSRWIDISFGAGAAVSSTLISAHLLDLYFPVYVDVNLVKEPFDVGSITLVGSAASIPRCYLAESPDSERCWLQFSASGGVVFQATTHLALLVEAARFWTLLEPGPAMGRGFLAGTVIGLGAQYRIR